MNSLEEKLISACSKVNLSLVEECLKNGANMNKVCSNGRTSLGVAAQIGDVDLLTLFLNTLNTKTRAVNCKGTTSRNDGSSNLGYFVVVHNEPKSPDECNLNNYHSSVCTKDVDIRGIDFEDFHASLVQSHPWMDVGWSFDEEILTPDGMDNLEWDAEIDDEVDVVTVEQDPWASLYLWYAKILSQTGALLEEKPPPDDVDGEDQFGCAALHYAAIEGHTEAILLLLRAGGRVNIEDSDNFSPLHFAASKEQPAVIDLLLQHGANPHSRSTDGITPLHIAASRGLLGNVKSLIAAGVNINCVDVSDRTPLHVAVSQQRHKVVAYLLDKGAKVNLEEMHGFTPLYEAVTRNDVGLVELLLAAGAKVTQSHHLLHYAVLHRHKEMARILLCAGSIINLRDEMGDTPLMLAVRTKYYSMIRLLLEHGASVHCINSVTRQTPLQLSICNLNRDCEQFDQVFSAFEEFGFDSTMESSSLALAISAHNDHAFASLVRRWDIASLEGLDTHSDTMNRILINRKKFLMELFVFAGFNLRTFQPNSFALRYTDELFQYLKNPLSLRDLTRISIRKSLGSRIYQKLNQLNIPPVYKSFLKLEDLPCTCQINRLDSSSNL